MPGRDGTGPRGLGSMTGRGLGYCTGVNAPMVGFGYGRGFGRGYGRGFGLGAGRGIRGGWGYYPVQPLNAPIYSMDPYLDSEAQLNGLKQELNYLDAEMENLKKAKDLISKKINEIEKTQ